MPTDAEIRAGWIAWIKKECNNQFLNDEGEEELPADIEHILLPYLINTGSRDPNVASESVSDLSRSFHSSDLPERMQRILKNYRRLAW